MIYIFKIMCTQSHTQIIAWSVLQSMASECCNIQYVGPFPLFPAGHEHKDQGHKTHTHTYTHKHACVCYNFAGNVQTMGVNTNHHLVVRGGDRSAETGLTLWMIAD